MPPKKKKWWEWDFSSKPNNSSKKKILNPTRPLPTASTNSPISPRKNSSTPISDSKSLKIMKPESVPQPISQLLTSSTGPKQEPFLPSSTKDNVDHAGHSPLLKPSEAPMLSSETKPTQSPNFLNNNSSVVPPPLLATSTSVATEDKWFKLSDMPWRIPWTPMPITDTPVEPPKSTVLATKPSLNKELMELKDTPPSKLDQTILLPSLKDNQLLSLSMLPIGQPIKVVSSLTALKTSTTVF